jgi:hypothetical protein
VWGLRRTRFELPVARASPSTERRSRAARGGRAVSSRLVLYYSLLPSCPLPSSLAVPLLRACSRLPDAIFSWRLPALVGMSNLLVKFSKSLLASVTFVFMTAQNRRENVPLLCSTQSSLCPPSLDRLIPVSQILRLTSTTTRWSSWHPAILVTSRPLHTVIGASSSAPASRRTILHYGVSPPQTPVRKARCI